MYGSQHIAMVNSFCSILEWDWMSEMSGNLYTGIFQKYASTMPFIRGGKAENINFPSLFNTFAGSILWEPSVPVHCLISTHVVGMKSLLLSLTQTFLEYTDAGASFVFGEKYKDHFFAFKVKSNFFLCSRCYFSSFSVFVDVHRT